MINSNQLINTLRILYNKYKKKIGHVNGLHNQINIHKTSTVIIKRAINGNNNTIEIGANCYIHDLQINLFGDNHRIKIGNNVLIQKAEFWIEDTNCEIIIGNLTSMENVKIAITENKKRVVIGNDCMLSDGIVLRTGDSHAIYSLKDNKKINIAKDIKIDNHVWIGSNVTILKGVSIGSNSVIGTGSIVTKSIPENCLAVGIPAVVIKDNINWARDRNYA